MFTQIITTITTNIDLDTFTPDISVEIEAGDGMPEAMAKSASIGGCKALLNTMHDSEPRLVENCVLQLVNNLGLAERVAAGDKGDTN